MQDVLSIFRQISFFKYSQDELLSDLAQYSTVNTYPPGEVILKQGQQNTTLFFLLKGSVIISVDGGVVAKLNKVSDLIGEMSVIMQTASTATTTAEASTEVLAIDTQKIQKLPGAQGEQLQKFLYKVYSFILADKLRLTNEKAKHFERMNTELTEAKERLEEKVKERTKELETQNENMKVSYKKMEEVFANRDVLFAKLEELSTEIKKTELKDSPVAKLLEPVIGLSRSEKSIKNKKVMIVDADKKQQVLAKTALLGTGVQLQTAATLEEAQAAFAKAPLDLVFFGPNEVAVNDWIAEKFPKCQTVLMTSAPMPEWHKYLKNLKRLPQIVSKSESDRAFTIKNIMTTVMKVATQDLWGLEKYLGWGIEVHDFEVNDSDHRHDVMKTMDEEFSKLTVRKSIRERVSAVAEEMLMNAIYDAPRDNAGKPLFNHQSRTEKVELPAGQRPHLRFATDGLYAAVSVVDPFGSLNASIVLKYLENCYSEAAGTLNKEGEKGGAGRGIHQIVENSDLVVFNVDKNKKTEVISIFYLDTQAMADKQPSFHFFSIG